MFKIEMFVDGRWSALGGRFDSRAEAESKIAEYLVCASENRRPGYRVVRVGDR